MKIILIIYIIYKIGIHLLNDVYNKIYVFKRGLIFLQKNENSKELKKYILSKSNASVNIPENSNHLEKSVQTDIQNIQSQLVSRHVGFQAIVNI